MRTLISVDTQSNAIPQVRDQKLHRLYAPLAVDAAAARAAPSREDLLAEAAGDGPEVSQAPIVALEFLPQHLPWHLASESWEALSGSRARRS